MVALFLVLLFVLDPKQEIVVLQEHSWHLKNPLFTHLQNYPIQKENVQFSRAFIPLLPIYGSTKWQLTDSNVSPQWKIPTLPLSWLESCPNRFNTERCWKPFYAKHSQIIFLNLNHQGWNVCLGTRGWESGMQGKLCPACVHESSEKWKAICGLKVIGKCKLLAKKGIRSQMDLWIITIMKKLLSKQKEKMVIIY